MSRLYSARVRDGVLVPDGITLSEGTVVTIAVNDERDTTLALAPEELAELDTALAEADAPAAESDLVRSSVVLAELDRMARASKR
jgi:hypothetical protein